MIGLLMNMKSVEYELAEETCSSATVLHKSHMTWAV
jgi:hypothetical protein